MLGFEILFEPEPSLDSVFKFSPSPSLEPRLGSKMLDSARLGLELDRPWYQPMQNTSKCDFFEKKVLQIGPCAHQS